MKKRLNPKAITGTGNLGFTYAHMTGSNEPVFLSKAHLSCTLQANIDNVQAWLGYVKVVITEIKTKEVLERVQDNMMNLASMIFTTSSANYSTEVSKLIRRLKSRIKTISEDLNPSEFQKYGVDEVHARWCLLTTNIRLLETVYVKWLQDFPIPKNKLEEYKLMGVLINLLSKWSSIEARYYCFLNKKEISVWECNYE